ncbi:lytic murein transglycosylase [Desulfovibrio sp. OttesenSCG-928-G15]|nr:lytic murein transglycosylase [Desulfovibrio sp. OttesenSCG-928-G15]
MYFSFVSPLLRLYVAALAVLLLLPAPAAFATSPEAPANEAARVRAELAQKPYGNFKGSVHPSWAPLYNRLLKDSGVNKKSLDVFRHLPAYSADPMGKKIREMYTNAFRKNPDAPPRVGVRMRIYKNIVTTTNIGRCRDFLARNKKYFDAVEKKYPIPRNIIVALLYVETKLGVYVGKDNALWSLACMAAANRPERVAPAINDLAFTTEQGEWLQTKLNEKSGWAYKELKALLNFCSVNRLDASCMPGSVYGAIGMCQFMPSNLEPYGDDGDGDGVVNLFHEPDAIFSAAKYLHKHGWDQGANVATQRKVLKRYNNLNIYANTILTLAESVRTGTVLAGPPDMPALAAAPNKRAAAQSGGAASPKAPSKKKAQKGAAKKNPKSKK